MHFNFNDLIQLVYIIVKARTKIFNQTIENIKHKKYFLYICVYCK